MELAQMSGLPAGALARQKEPEVRNGRGLTAGLFGSSAAAPQQRKATRATRENWCVSIAASGVYG